MKKLILTSTITIFSVLTIAVSGAWGQHCPRIEQRGDTLFAVPADAAMYRWYKDGVPIPEQNEAYLVIDENGEYSVEVFGTSQNEHEMEIEDLWLTVKLSGRVFDPELAPVAGARVVFQNQTVYTDANGQYFFEPVTTRGGRTWVVVTHEGFFHGQTAVYFSENDEEYQLSTMLFSKADSIVFNAGAGAFFHNSDFSLDIPANAFVDENGQPFEGEVTLNYSFVPPDFPNFGMGMPGGDFLVENGGDESVLISYGIIAAEARGATGRRVNLAPGASVRLSVRMPAGMTMQPSAALWSFNPVTGAWIRTGPVFARANGTLTGTLDDFSRWTNIDYYGISGRVRGRVVNCHGQPVPFAQVGLIWGSSTYQTIADSKGRFGFMNVPANVNLSIQTATGSVNFTIPSWQTVNLNDIQVNAANFTATAFLTWNNVNQNSATLQVFINGPSQDLQFSVDSVHWQTDRIFNFPNATGLNVKMPVWIRRPDGCVTRIEAYLRRRGAGCYLPAGTNLASLPIYDSWFEAVQAYNDGNAIYRYQSCENLNLAIAHFICLRELDLSNCNLSQLPDGFRFLLGLRRLNLSNNPISSIPEAIMGLPNLELLDMRGTNVSYEERSGYEQQMPDVTIYWENCDVPGNEWDWARSMGSAQNDDVFGIAAHADGGMAIAGRVGPGASVGGVNLNNGGVFVARFDRLGNLAWVRSFAANDVTGIALLPDSTVCLVGTYFNELDLGNGITLESPQWQGGFVCRLDAAGNTLWAQSFDGSDDDALVALAAAPDGSQIALLGNYKMSVAFAGETLNAVANQELYWCRMNPQGEILESRFLSGSGSIVASDIEIGADGALYIAASFNDSLFLPLDTLTGVGAVLLKYNSENALVWHRASTDVQIHDIAVLQDGTVFLVGSFENSADWGGVQLTSDGPRDGFLVKYSPNGMLQWNRALGATGSDDVSSVVVRNDSLLFLVGTFEGSMSFAGTTHTAQETNAYLAKMTVNGTEIWSRVIGGSGSDRGISGCLSDGNTIGVVGEYENSVQLGAGTLGSAGGSDLFFVKVCGN